MNEQLIKGVKIKRAGRKMNKEEEIIKLNRIQIN